MHSRPIGLPVCVLSVIVLHASFSQAQPPTYDNCATRTFTLGVLDRGQYTFEDLAAANLVVKAGKHNLAVERITLSSPRRMALLLDVSGSMLAENKWQVVQLLAQDAIRVAPPEVEIALATFGNQYFEIVGYTQDRDALQKALSGLTYESLKRRKGTQLTFVADALQRAIHDSLGAIPGDVIYVLTDGEGTDNRGRLKDIRKQLLQQGMRAYFAFARDPVVVHDAEMDAVDLADLAAASGGHVVDLSALHRQTRATTWFELSENNMRSLYSAASALYASMFRFYGVQVGIPEGLQQTDQKLAVSLVDQSGEKMKKLTLLHPKQLLRCTSAARASAP